MRRGWSHWLLPQVIDRVWHNIKSRFEVKAMREPNDDEVLAYPSSLSTQILKEEERIGRLLTRAEVIGVRDQLTRFPISRELIEKIEQETGWKDFGYETCFDEYLSRREDLLQLSRIGLLNYTGNDLTKRAWCQAERFIRRHFPLKEGYAELIRVGSELHPSPLWEQYAGLDIDTDANDMANWLAGIFNDSEARPCDDISIISFLLHDVPERFDIRGDTISTDEMFRKLWWWDRSSEYEFAGDGLYRSPMLDRWMWSDEVEDDRDLYSVNEFFTTLAYLGLMAEHMFRNLEPRLILGSREERWLAVGQGEAGSGTILGKLTPR